MNVPEFKAWFKGFMEGDNYDPELGPSHRQWKRVCEEIEALEVFKPPEPKSWCTMDLSGYSSNTNVTLQPDKEGMDWAMQEAKRLELTD